MKLSFWKASPAIAPISLNPESTRCIIIERSRFDYLKKFDPHFMVSLIKSLTERLRTTITNLNRAKPSKKGSLPIKTTVSDYYDIKGE